MRNIKRFGCRHITCRKNKKMASYLYRTAQPPILAAFLPWGGSAGAGRIRLAAAKVRVFYKKWKF